jgi:uncharacterized protein YndB with AHSA1/START domain
MSKEPDVTVRVTQIFRAGPERVFDAWLDTTLIGKWMFGPKLREEEIIRLSVDARVGGSFSFLVRRNGEELDHVGRYLEIDRPRRLVFTWSIGEQSDDSRVTIDIVPQGAGCELTLTHTLDPAWADYAERTQAGWTKMIGVLAQTLDEE